MKTLTKKLMIATVSTLAIAGTAYAQDATAEGSGENYERNIEGFKPARQIEGTEASGGVDAAVTTGSVEGDATIRTTAEYFDGKGTGENEMIPGSTPDELAAARAEVAADPALAQELADRGLDASAIVGSETALNGDRIYIVE